ncbi:hypothetical protein BKA70DRAFT_1262272 [Coprinopsis sp. MPI-PUGE-AT-0042]|nr:hypothetical protein BKA70DRAFT_1262272 [Coprinopsis sp. MPI-PUGE-AT-0042]
MKLLYLSLIFLVTIVNAQTFTTTNEDGATIIGVVSSDPVLGPSTRIISTAAPTGQPTSTSTSASPTTTTEEEEPPLTEETFRGPVGESPTTPVGTPYLPFRFQYTTLVPDGAGGVSTRVITQTFTPTNPPNVTHTYPTNGTILGYDEYTSMFGVPKEPGAASSLRIPSCCIIAALSLVYTFL